jgi:hypothetical protein
MKTMIRGGRSAMTLLGCAVFCATLFLLQPAEVQAQWTTPDASQNINNTNSGNVGIGTTTPAQKLEISSVSPLIQMSDTSGIGIKWTLGTTGQWSGLSANRNLVTGSHFDTGKTTTGYFMFVGNGNSFHWWGTTPTNNAEPIERMRLDKDGNLGIGTASPTAAAGYTALSLNNSTGTLVDFMTNSALKARLQSDGTTFYFNNLANGPIQIYTNNAERMRIDAGGNIGIGTTSPVYSLDVNGGVNGFRAKAASALANDTIATFENNSAIQMIVRANGNVGIGTTSPANKLHVAGSITVDGNINAKYQDVAEWVESSQELAAGIVVILDPAKSNQVIASTQSYDSRVAGVISVQPGIALGENREGRVLVASSGRVKVKVDATNGPIQIGDLLVTSDKEGVAMKSVPVEIAGVRIHRPGTLIGKALEPLAQGAGEILVLLSLQ